jgi:hypothetical protein
LVCPPPCLQGPADSESIDLEEVEGALANFKNMLKRDWIGQAAHTLMKTMPPDKLSDLTENDVLSLPKSDWEKREQQFHLLALAQLNKIVQVHNNVASESAKMSLFGLDEHLEDVYNSTSQEILEKIRATPPTTLKNGPTTLENTISQFDQLDASGNAVHLPISRDDTCAVCTKATSPRFCAACAEVSFLPSLI